jgi:hypothetical protein
LKVDLDKEAKSILDEMHGRFNFGHYSDLTKVPTSILSRYGLGCVEIKRYVNLYTGEVTTTEKWVWSSLGEQVRGYLFFPDASVN